MTLAEIHQRLNEEFPDRNVSFDVTVHSTDEAPDVQIYDAELECILPCSNLEDGINQLKLKLGMIQPEMEIEI